MQLSPKIWWVLPAACVALGILASQGLSCLQDFPGILAMKEGLVFGFVLLASCSLQVFLLKAYPTKVGLLAYSVLIGLFTGFMAAFLHAAISDWVFNNAEHMQLQNWKLFLQFSRWMLYPSLLLIWSISAGLYKRMDEIQSRYALQQDAAALLKEAELFKLRQQLQPHFLYNSLNAIASLLIINPAKAGEMISRLSDFLRSSVKQGRSEWVNLEEELEFLRNYLWIESLRFGDRLKVEWDIEESVKLAKIPPFLLQPIMENAIRYGVYGKTGDVVIDIRISMELGIVKIRISNPYDPTLKADSGTGFGLSGVRRRLYLMYARQDLLQTQEMDGYFITTLQIPQ